MTTSFRPLEIRRRLGKDVWGIPRQQYNLLDPTQLGDGWFIDMNTVERTGRIIISAGSTDEADREDWWHASISYPDHMPSYEDLTLLHHAVWPDGWAYQVFAPPSAHINIHPYALHLWGRPDGRALLPNFGAHGSI